MSHRLTIEQIRQRFAEKDRELLETEYKNNQQRLKYRCLKCSRQGTCSIVGLRHESTGCYGCNQSLKERSYTQEEIEEIYRKEGCEFRDVFRTIRNKATYKCACGNIHQMSVDHFLRGCRCDQCGNKKISESLRTTEKEIIDFCENNGCQLIDFWLEEYGTQGIKKTVVEFKCQCEKIHQSFWCNFSRYPNCPDCGNARKSGDKCHMWNPDREKVARNKLIQKRCYNLVKRTLDKFNQHKDNYKSEILGYEVKDLYNRIYIEHSNFNFDQEWEIDHIFPVQAFVDHDVDNMKLINHLSNLQPLSKADNNAKSDKYNNQEFLDWMSKKNIS